MNDVIKKNGVNFGIIIGIVSVLISTILYIINLELMFSIWVGIIMFLISLGIAIFSIVKSKKTLDGYITFKEAFTSYFITMALSSIISTLFMFVLFNYVDPEAKVTLSEIALKKSVEMMQSVGAKSEDIRSTVEQIKDVDNFSIASLAKSYIFGLIFYIIIGLIVAAAIKKNKPEFEN
ncbi:DUF4199 domain-containing protein [Flavobacterium arcticum]|uniref:DUF4199 domain-containing protein n=1 Tax=Flavobacterium arcticum TaxID=1784713 RepID=A0A345HEX8_9FLAO|nr:DUF4199 domain-containing protein [Flavobacterium arcticum]AXG75138.1 DUF4199 domain-containing protein [Flavobacterium arcticum]KAF2511082.1 DUF4199 domain-containing protein [Flavobacterium arcticum]